jgi:molybdopterin-guanine dinucleotide biosynthesis protein A
MGQDKALLTLKDFSLLDRTIDCLSVVSDDVLVVGREQIDPPDERDVRVLPDEFQGKGPLAGLLTGLRAAHHRHSIAVACDLPFLSAHVLRSLLNLAPGYQAVVPRVGGHAQMLHAVYRRDILPVIVHQLERGDYRVESLLEYVTTRWVEEDELVAKASDRRSFANVNTLEEWQRVLDEWQVPQ